MPQLYRPTVGNTRNTDPCVISISIGTAAVLAAFSVYYCTVAPGLTVIDSGELAAVCTTAGIAHPTGYPLYTMLGWCVTQLFPENPIATLNMLSAGCACAALAVFYRVLSLILQQIGAGRRALPPRLAAFRSIWFASACGTLFLAFCRPFWQAALVTEVYALQSLLLCIFMLVALKTCGVMGTEDRRIWSQAALFFAGGLILTNHMTAIYYLPAFLYLYAAMRRHRELSIKKAFLPALSFAAGLTPYLYLPLKAAQEPSLNWGDPSSAASFFEHVTGRQYSVWMFDSMETVVRQSLYFFDLLPGAVGYVPLALAPLGMWHLFRAGKKLWWFSLLLFTVPLAGALSYDIFDIDAYFLPAYICLALWMASGVYFCIQQAEKVFATRSSLLAPACCALAVFPLALNYSAVNQSGNTLADTYCRSILENIEPGALVFSYQWDYFCSPALYMQLVEGLRPDVTIIETKLLKRSWYLKQLENSYPGLTRSSRGALERYRRELYMFESGKPYDAAVIQKRYIALINSFIKNSRGRHPVYITGEQPPFVGKGLCRIPEGLVFRLLPCSSGYLPFAALSRLKLPSPEQFQPGNRYHENLRNFYAGMLAARSSYELRYNKMGKARDLLNRAAALHPRHPYVQKLRRLLPGHNKKTAEAHPAEL